MIFKFDRRRGLGLILLLSGLALLIIYLVRQAAPAAPAALPTPSPSPTVTRIPERLIPTATVADPNPPAGIATVSPSSMPRGTRTIAEIASPSVTRAATRTPLPTVTADRSIASSSTPVPVTTTAQPAAITDLKQRFGVGVGVPAPWIQRLTDLNAGWFLDWMSSAPSGRPARLDYVRMVRVPQGQPKPALTELAAIAQRSPGSLWLIGNEPDVIWQDNATPAQYIQAYHAVYTTLKQADPTSRIAIGGITEPSPLRLQYLDLILNGYRERYGEEMPIDVWNVHNFILPEKRGDWGVDIPPGLAANSGLIVGIQDHDDLARFKQQIVDFRRWLAQRGFRDKELIVSEYGVLMYEDLGFDYARVRAFMLGTFDYFLSATDSTIGLPTDGNRLVQRWCWYSLSDDTYPTGNLVDRTTGKLTPLGRDFADYVNQRISK